MAAEVKTYGKVEWDKLGERLYETGVDHVVLYQFMNGKYTNGVAWNGVTSVTENKSGAEASPLYADNIKYLVLKSLEEYGVTVECYTYPKEFEQNNGMAELASGVTIGQQTRATFGLSFRTLVGNDTEHENYGYKLHLVYGCDAAPSEESNATINDSPEAKTLSYEVSCTPVTMTDGRSTCCVTIDSKTSDAAKLKALEDKLYGGEGVVASLPLPDEVAEIFNAETIAANVTAGKPGKVYYGVTPSELQENIQIADTNITGTLKHQADYSGFGGEEKEGYFVVLDFSTYEPGTTVKTKIGNGTGTDFKDATADGFCVYKIDKSKTQTIIVQTGDDAKAVTTTYSLGFTYTGED